MKNLYRTINPNSFKLLSFCIALIGDGMLLNYLYSKFTDRELFLRILTQAWKSKNNPGNPPPYFVNEFFQLWNNSLLLMLILVGSFHFIIYILWQLNKKSPSKYVVLYFKAGMVGFPLMGLVLLLSDPVWGGIFLGIGAGYYFNMAGITFYKGFFNTQS